MTPPSGRDDRIPGAADASGTAPAAAPESQSVAPTFRGCWFVSTDGDTVEPMTEGQILSGLRRRQLTPETLVTLDSNGPWCAIADVPALENAMLLFRGVRQHSSRPPRPVILEALPASGETNAIEPPRAKSLALRARNYLSAFFAATLFAALFLL